MADMSVALSHWSRPRLTIANRHKEDDFAYALHGAQSAAYALKYIDEKPSVLAEKTLLDYGCGTGRISRVFASHFKSVVGYDPSAECIDEAGKECPGITIKNAKFTNSVPTERFDYAVSINVIEHLAFDDAKAAINNMRAVANKCVIWYHTGRNAELLVPMMTDAQKRAHNECVQSGKRINIVVIQ